MRRIVSALTLLFVLTSLSACVVYPAGGPRGGGGGGFCYYHPYRCR